MIVLCCAGCKDIKQSSTVGKTFRLLVFLFFFCHRRKNNLWKKVVRINNNYEIAVSSVRPELVAVANLNFSTCVFWDAMQTNGNFFFPTQLRVSVRATPSLLWGAISRTFGFHHWRNFVAAFRQAKERASERERESVKSETFFVASHLFIFYLHTSLCSLIYNSRILQKGSLSSSAKLFLGVFSLHC